MFKLRSKITFAVACDIFLCVQTSVNLVYGLRTRLNNMLIISEKNWTQRTFVNSSQNSVLSQLVNGSLINYTYLVGAAREITSTVLVYLSLPFLYVSQITFDPLNLFRVFFLSTFVFITISHYPIPPLRLSSFFFFLPCFSVSPLSLHISLCLHHHLYLSLSAFIMWNITLSIPLSISVCDILPLFPFCLSLHLCLSKHLALPPSLSLFLSVRCFFVVFLFCFTLCQLTWLLIPHNPLSLFCLKVTTSVVCGGRQHYSMFMLCVCVCHACQCVCVSACTERSRWWLCLVLWLAEPICHSKWVTCGPSLHSSVSLPRQNYENSCLLLIGPIELQAVPCSVQGF